MRKKLAILIIIIALLLLGYPCIYIAYQMKYEQASIYVASHRLSQRSIITEDDLKEISIPISFLDDSIMRNKEEIIGKCVKFYNTIPANSFIYSSAIEDVNNIDDQHIFNLRGEEVTYDLYLNEVKANPAGLIPGINIDLYLTLETSIDSALIYQNIPVIAAYNSDGKSLLKDHSKVASVLTLALKRADVIILNKALLIGKVSLSLSRSAYNENIRAEAVKDSDLFALIDN